MIKIEALESIKSDGYIAHEGDRLTVSRDVAKRWCEVGWAKAMNGEFETMPRHVVRSTVSPHNSILVPRSDEVANKER